MKIIILTLFVIIQSFSLYGQSQYLSLSGQSPLGILLVDNYEWDCTVLEVKDGILYCNGTKFKIQSANDEHYCIAKLVGGYSSLILEKSLQHRVSFVFSQKLTEGVPVLDNAAFYSCVTSKRIRESDKLRCKYSIANSGEYITEGAYFDKKSSGHFMVFSFYYKGAANMPYTMYFRDMGDTLDESTRDKVYQSAIDLLSPRVVHGKP